MSSKWKKVISIVVYEFDDQAVCDGLVDKITIR